VTTKTVLEIGLVERAKRLLHRAGGEFIKTHGSSLRQGEPDLIGCYRGRFVAIELKAPGHKPRPLQYKRLRDWARAGAIAIWSSEPEEILPIIERAMDDPSYLIDGRPTSDAG
jgi:hypothetical protein